MGLACTVEESKTLTPILTSGDETQLPPPKVVDYDKMAQDYFASQGSRCWNCQSELRYNKIYDPSNHPGSSNASPNSNPIGLKIFCPKCGRTVMETMTTGPMWWCTEEASIPENPLPPQLDRFKQDTGIVMNTGPYVLNVDDWRLVLLRSIFERAKGMTPEMILKNAQDNGCPTLAVLLDKQPRTVLC